MSISELADIQLSAYTSYFGEKKKYNFYHEMQELKIYL